VTAIERTFAITLDATVVHRAGTFADIADAVEGAVGHRSSVVGRL
jgi:hypothetical protein